MLCGHMLAMRRLILTPEAPHLRDSFKLEPIHEISKRLSAQQRDLAGVIKIVLDNAMKQLIRSRALCQFHIEAVIGNPGCSVEQSIVCVA